MNATLRTLIAASSLFSLSAWAAEEVNLYSHRHYESDEALFAEFTEETGIEVKVVKASADELIERLKSEGDNSPADLLVTADAGRLHRAKTEGLLQAVSAPSLEEAIPEHLRDPEGYWFALTQRARIFAYAKDRVKAEELPSYEDLANVEWRGRIAVRSSSNIYNQSLLASLISANGEEEAAAWATAIRENMARPPQGSDRDQMRAVAAGLADIAIVNTYYLGILLNSDDPKDVKVGEAIGVFFPNQGEDGRGAHINISGAGITKSSKNKENAIKLLEFLVSRKAQAAFAKANFEYPVRTDMAPSELLSSWGSFKADTLNLSELGENNTKAVEIFDTAGWE